LVLWCLVVDAASSRASRSSAVPSGPLKTELLGRGAIPLVTGPDRRRLGRLSSDQMNPGRVEKGLPRTSAGRVSKHLGHFLHPGRWERRRLHRPEACAARLNMGERYTCVYNALQKTSAYVDPGLEGGGGFTLYLPRESDPAWRSLRPSLWYWKALCSRFRPRFCSACTHA
jgi:hypothetical protein